jgi:pyruvate dehydrogenase E1 component
MEVIRKEVLSGAYRLIDYSGSSDYHPGDNVVHIFAMGALAEEAVKASDQLLAKGILANVIVVTSPDLLLGNYAYENDYEYLLSHLGVNGSLNLHGDVNHTGDWYFLQGNRTPIVSVHDGEPGLLDNIGSIVGAKQIALAIRKTSKSGTTEDIFHYHKIDAEGVVAACEKALTMTAKEEFKVSRRVLEAIQ